jgi:hypothetical protein
MVMRRWFDPTTVVARPIASEVAGCVAAMDVAFPAGRL